jgi:hypothetical protein
VSVCPSHRGARRRQQVAHSKIEQQARSLIMSVHTHNRRPDEEVTWKPKSTPSHHSRGKLAKQRERPTASDLEFPHYLLAY